MDGMKAKRVLDDLDRDHLREQLELNPDEPIPEILLCKLVAAAKPEDVAPISIRQAEGCERVRTNPTAFFALGQHEA